MSNIYELSASELSSKIRNKEVSSVEATQSYIDRSEAVEPQIKSYITKTYDFAIETAKKVDERISKGEELLPLEGVPMGIKDVISTSNIRTTCGSKMLENYVPVYDATVYRKIKERGIPLLGKMNCDEFAMGSSGENSSYDFATNPYNTNCVPGGSSSGSTSAVCANQCAFALGSDTGGSIRQPASLCGIVGLKPTYGLVSRFGLVAYASSFDSIGPLAKTVEDAANVLDVIAGYDKNDSTSLNVKLPEYAKSLTSDCKGLKIGIPTEFFGEGINEEIKASLFEALEKYKSMGATVEEFSFPYRDHLIACYYVLACAEASSNLARFDGIKYGYRSTTEASDLIEFYKNTRTEGFGEEVKRRIMLGTYVLSSGYYDAYYKKAQSVRTLIKQEFEKAFQKYDVLITPTSPVPAWEFGGKSDPLEMYLADLCTVSLNIASIPGISIPCGMTNNGLPIGMQIIGKPLGELDILNAAYAYEKNTSSIPKAKI